jgi:hypothetical protein
VFGFDDAQDLALDLVQHGMPERMTDGPKAGEFRASGVAGSVSDMSGDLVGRWRKPELEQLFGALKRRTVGRLGSTRRMRLFHGFR